MYRYNQTAPGSSTSQTDLPLKRSQHSEDEESAFWSWHSADKKKENQMDDQQFQHDEGIKRVPPNYRKWSTNTQTFIRHPFSPSVMKDLNLKQYLEFMEDDVLIVRCKIHKLLYNEDMDEEEREDAIDLIKNSSSSRHIKTAFKITKDIISHIFSSSILKKQESEANQIFELLRPFLTHCWILRLTGVKYDWLTYPPQHSSSQLMIHDYILFVEPYASITFELCFVEVKRKGNDYKGNYEFDLVKLDHVATAFKIDLKYNEQYQMVKISAFNFIRKTPDDILLLPTLMEKLKQMKRSTDAF
ncbi:uncharacterized protein BX663DRAFT_485936 [Cokeromyces recurvatus]|uniref:uncharacterized protein n=1 Tax=Cokeromyces recurvatus TaxID=90255 RepID=UPI00221EEDD6|nr:uncharacterized protein BX663DRAFT_485936 [Cokeromyces recurvatus]KAI7903196.1 hypothetical protein BX663DRAFT_485936 [Cokeromyces recurvatus]